MDCEFCYDVHDKKLGLLKTTSDGVNHIVGNEINLSAPEILKLCYGEIAGGNASLKR